MYVPVIKGLIDRRILINYQIEPSIIRRILPEPFIPKLVRGKVIAGICLIRLKSVRPAWFPFDFGISSENGAHRIAVEWLEGSERKEGVFIPRRDTSSRINAIAGGRFFPGVHHRASFIVDERDGNYSIEFKSEDNTFVSIRAHDTNEWNAKSIFEDQNCASDFFRSGSVGYSPNQDSFDGMELDAKTWAVSPLNVSFVKSSFFENRQLFPEGSVTFDNALVMKGIAHEWRSKRSISPNIEE